MVTVRPGRRDRFDSAHHNNRFITLSGSKTGLAYNTGLHLVLGYNVPSELGEMGSYFYRRDKAGVWRRGSKDQETQIRFAFTPFSYSLKILPRIPHPPETPQVITIIKFALSNMQHSAYTRKSSANSALSARNSSQ